MEYDIKRLRFVTRNYGRLQSLPWAMAGLMRILWGCLSWFGGEGMRSFARENAVLSWFIFAAVFGLFLIGLRIIPRYYQKKFGVVTGPVGPSEPTTPIEYICYWALVVACIFIIPAYFPGLIIRLWLIVGVYLIWSGLRLAYLPHRIVAGLIFLGLSVAPLFHWASNDQLAQGLESLVSGLALAIFGLGDHWVLVRSFPQMGPEESHG